MLGSAIKDTGKYEDHRFNVFRKKTENNFSSVIEG